VFNVFEEKELIKELNASPISLAHFDVLCDSVGIKQHAIHGVPLLESGYTVDDNARALIGMLDFGELFQKERALPYCLRFLSFMNFMQQPSGWFRNTLSFNRSFEDSGGSQDCFGRSVWACGKTVNSWLQLNHRLNAEKMLEKAFPLALKLEEPRPIAFSLLGLAEMAKARPKEEKWREGIELLGLRLVELFEENSGKGWQWFEDVLTYDNARMCQAMFLGFEATGRKRFLEVGEKSFGFLVEKTLKGEMFEPVGQDGWFPREGKKALFDQQPIEAGAMVQAATQAFFATANDDYKRIALTCFNWFFGGNKLGAAVYDKKTGACFDGITPEEVNLNQGSESLLEFLLARFCIERMKRQKI